MKCRSLSLQQSTGKKKKRNIYFLIYGISAILRIISLVYQYSSSLSESIKEREKERERERERRKPLSCSFLHFLPSPLSAPSPLPAPLHEQKLSGLNQSDEMAQPERQARGNAVSHFFNKVLIRDVGAGVRPLHEIGVAVSRRLSGPMEDTGQFVGLLSTSCISQDDTIGRQLIGSRNVLTAPLSGILREGEGVVGGGEIEILASNETYGSSGWVAGCVKPRSGRGWAGRRRRGPCGAGWTRPPGRTTVSWMATLWTASTKASSTACCLWAPFRCRSCGPSASAGVRSSL